jgi:predicted deacylase
MITMSDPRTSPSATRHGSLAPLLPAAGVDPVRESAGRVQVEQIGGGLRAFRLTAPDPSLRVGLFAGIHGDETAGSHALTEVLLEMAREPMALTGYDLVVVPVCNPTGFLRGTRESATGHDLNREFWRHSEQPEVLALEALLRRYHWDGLISLHADDTSSGCYGFVKGWELTRHVLEPALMAAEKFLPRNYDRSIDNFDANHGIITQGYPGVLGAPPEHRPRPFEIVFETPQRASFSEQIEAHRSAVRTMLDAYRGMISHAQNL